MMKTIGEQMNSEKYNMKAKITNIIYDLDSDGIDLAYDEDQKEIKEIEKKLPKEMTLELPDDCDVEDEIADIISDKTGWCVQGYNYEII